MQVSLTNMPQESRDHAYAAIMSAPSILGGMVESIAEARTRGQVSLCIGLLSDVLEQTGSSFAQILCRHHSAFVELVGVLRVGAHPLDSAMHEVWALLSQLVKFADAKSLVRSWAESNLTRLIVEMLRLVAARFLDFETQPNLSRSWIMPLLIWGALVVMPDKLCILKANEELLSNDIHELVAQIFQQISSSSHLDLDAMVMPGLHLTLRHLCNCAFHDDHFPWVLGGVRAILRSDRLIQEFASLGLQSGPGGIVMFKSCGAASLIRSVPPVLEIHRTGRYVCMQCDGSVQHATSCQSCNCMPYCSIECRRVHWPVHKGVCSASMSTRDANDQVTKANAELSSTLLNTLAGPASVYLLEYSRSPSSFRDCLINSVCPTLQACCSALEAHGFDVERSCSCIPNKLKPCWKSCFQMDGI